MDIVWKFVTTIKDRNLLFLSNFDFTSKITDDVWKIRVRNIIDPAIDYNTYEKYTPILKTCP